MFPRSRSTTTLLVLLALWVGVGLACQEDSRAYAVLTTVEPVAAPTVDPVDAVSPAVKKLPTAAVLLQ